MHFKPNLFVFICVFVCVCVHARVCLVSVLVLMCVCLYAECFNFKYMIFNKFEFSSCVFHMRFTLFPFYFTEELQHKLGNISLTSFISKTLENDCIPDVFNISHNFTHLPFLTLLFSCLSTLLTWIFSYDLSPIFSLLCDFKAHLYSDIIQWSRIKFRVIFLTTLNL